MTTIVLDLLTILKQHPDNTVVTITDVDDTEFAIVDFKHDFNTVNIVIRSKEEEDEDEE